MSHVYQVVALCAKYSETLRHLVYTLLLLLVLLLLLLVVVVVILLLLSLLLLILLLIMINIAITDMTNTNYY